MSRNPHAKGVGDRLLPTLVSALARWAALASIICLAWLAVPSAEAGEWKGKELQRDGGLHVTNPDQPMEEASTSELESLWRLGGDTDDEDEFFGVISQILTDDEGNVYLLDTQLSQVKIFSPQGEFLRDIGREGEGPGEFRYPTSMFFTNTGDVAVMQLQPGKIVLLTREGEPAGEYPIPTPDGGGMLLLLSGRAAQGNVVLAAAEQAFEEGKYTQTRYIAAVTSDGTESVRYHSEPRVIEFANAVLDDRAWDTFDRRWAVADDGRVFACISYDNYAVHVWNGDGTLDRIVERDYKHRKRTDKELEIVTDLMSLFAKRIPNCTVKITDNTKDIETIYVREDGSLWVLTSDGARDMPDGSIGVFDVFDSKGRFVHQVTLMGEGNPLTDGLYFVRDRLYVVTDLVQAALSLQGGGETIQIGDEEPEPMSVFCYQLSGDLVTTSR